MKKINFVRAIRRSGTSFTVSIPPELIEILELHEGDFLNVEIEKIIKK